MAGVSEIQRYTRVGMVSESRLEPGDFSPRLVQSYYYLPKPNTPKGRRLGSRMVYDFELEYITDADGAQVIDGQVYPVHKGDIVFRRPGQQTEGIMRYSCFCVIFDLEGKQRPDRIPYWNDKSPEKPQQPNFRSSFIDAIPPVFSAPGGEVYKALFETALKHFASPVMGSELIQKAAVLQILYQLHADVCDPLTRVGTNRESDAEGKTGAARPKTAGAEGSKVSPTQRKIQSALAFMRQHFRRKLPLEEMAAKVGLSPAHFHKVFVEMLGQTPLDHVTALRIDAAKEMLAATDLSGANIALECGFENVPYFFTLFKKMTGETPGSFRERHRFPIG